MPILSIGMPVFNGGHFLHEAIESILKQTFVDFELVISDNASTDESEAICRQYASQDERIRYIRQPMNIGALENFQFVLDSAVGAYFMWSAADDVFDSRWLEVLLPVSIKNQCLSFGLAQVIDHSGGKIAHPCNSRKMQFVGNPLMRRLKYFVSPGILGKANLIHGIFPIALLKHPKRLRLLGESIGADQLFLYALLGRMDFRHAGSSYLYKRVHNESVGATVTTEKAGGGVIPRIGTFLRGSLLISVLARYLQRSSVIEAALILFSYPVFVVLNVVWALRAGRINS